MSLPYFHTHIHPSHHRSFAYWVFWEGASAYWWWFCIWECASQQPAGWICAHSTGTKHRSRRSSIQEGGQGSWCHHRATRHSSPTSYISWLRRIPGAKPANCFSAAASSFFLPGLPSVFTSAGWSAPFSSARSPCKWTHACRFGRRQICGHTSGIPPNWHWGHLPPSLVAAARACSERLPLRWRISADSVQCKIFGASAAALAWTSGRSSSIMIIRIRVIWQSV